MRWIAKYLCFGKNWSYFQNTEDLPSTSSVVPKESNDAPGANSTISSNSLQTRVCDSVEGAPPVSTTPESVQCDNLAEDVQETGAACDSRAKSNRSLKGTESTSC